MFYLARFWMCRSSVFSCRNSGHSIPYFFSCVFLNLNTYECVEKFLLRQKAALCSELRVANLTIFSTYGTHANSYSCFTPSFQGTRRSVGSLCSSVCWEVMRILSKIQGDLMNVVMTATSVHVSWTLTRDTLNWAWVKLATNILIDCITRYRRWQACMCHCGKMRTSSRQRRWGCSDSDRTSLTFWFTARLRLSELVLQYNRTLLVGAGLLVDNCTIYYRLLDMACPSTILNKCSNRSSRYVRCHNAPSEQTVV